MSVTDAGAPDFLWQVGFLTGARVGREQLLDQLLELALEYAAGGIELTLPEGLDALDEREDAQQIRAAVEDGREAFMAAAHVTATTPSFAELCERRSEPERGRATHQRAWAGWAGGDAA